MNPSSPLPSSAAPSAPSASPPPSPSIVGILLAAGAGRRFDPQGKANKLMAPLDDLPVAVRSARLLRQATPRMLAVVRPQADAVARMLRADSVTVHVCLDAALGMGHSLAHGVRMALESSPGLQAVMVALGDMPFVRPATFTALMRAAAGCGPELNRALIAPRHPDGRGHPVLFGKQHFDALLALEGDRGAAALFASQPVLWVDVDDPGVLRDVDLPSDLNTLPPES